MVKQWKPGMDIGHYRLEQLIGRGGVGEVWRANDSRLGRSVAIKVITQSGQTGELIRRFGREAKVLAHLNHPSIVQIYDVGREDESPYIVTELVDGLDLATLIAEGRIRIPWGLQIARQVATAIQLAHDREIVHRDIKPSNILIDQWNDQAKLTDFGLAKGAELISSITSVGEVFGTPAYMSPEQSEGKEIDPTSDIYSLGASLYHLFTGRPPHDPTNLVSLIKEKSTIKPKAPVDLNPNIPESLSSAILLMLEPNPANRPPSLDGLIKLLDDLIEKYPTPVGETLKERAIEVPADKPAQNQITLIGRQEAPTGYFDTNVFPKSKFFEDDSIRFSKIQETLKFYRDHLNNEYQNLLRQANMTYRLWLACVGLGFLVLLGGISAMLMGKIPEGAATAASTILVYFIQRVFQQREDHYRGLAKSKNSHLEYGNQWLLVIQSIDAIDDPTERTKRQSRLVEVLTDKLLIFPES